MKNQEANNTFSIEFLFGCEPDTGSDEKNENLN